MREMVTEEKEQEAELVSLRSEVCQGRKWQWSDTVPDPRKIRTGK